MKLDASKIESCNDCERRKVDVPEWGGSIFVRSLNVSEADEFSRRTRKIRADDSGGMSDLYAWIASVAIVNENGDRLFSDDDKEKLKTKSWKVLDRIANVVIDLSGLSAESEKDIEGNSIAGLTGNSNSD